LSLKNAQAQILATYCPLLTKRGIFNANLSTSFRSTP
jgi:hypothetical protein